MNEITSGSNSRRARALYVLLLGFVTAVTHTTPMIAQPAITGATMAGASPQLSILGVMGTTNEILTITNLAKTNWTVVTNLVVKQSPYTFVDKLTPRGLQRFYRVVDPHWPADSAVAGMSLIPAGSFQMGDSFSEGAYYELPVHTVNVSAFYMDKYEVTDALWESVNAWSATNGYTYDYPGEAKAPNHPIEGMDWYDAVKWCNARSQMEKRAPAYYTDAALTQVYKTGQVAPYVNWNAGFRLPTESEWEKAARGGAVGHRFPWADVDTISESRANYYADTNDYSYDTSSVPGFNPAFDDGDVPYTSPVGSFAPNGYGLYDMAGNVWEWCWDYADNYPSEAQTDPRGPTTGTTRVGRGGNWNYYAVDCRCAYRYGNSPLYVASNIGFRCALPSP